MKFEIKIQFIETGSTGIFKAWGEDEYQAIARLSDAINRPFAVLYLIELREGIWQKIKRIWNSLKWK